MKRVNMATWIVTGLAIGATGCTTAAPTSTAGTDAPIPSAQLNPERGVLTDGPETNDEVLKALPKRISEADAKKILVHLPSDMVQGSLLADADSDRSTLQRGRGGFRGGGFRGGFRGGFGGFRGGFRGRGFGGFRGRGFRSFGLSSFAFYPYGSYYYPYYLDAGYYYPYSYPYYSDYYYPYYYGYRSYYYPRSWRYGYRWW